jgi:acyl dehydratase
MKLKDTYETDFSFSQEEVNRFSELTGDKNPLHLDAEFASKTLFKKPIMHGVLSVSVFSKVLGMEFPGEGTVYMGQNIEFKRPMYVDEVYKAVCEVVEVDLRRNIAIISTKVFNAQTNKLTVSGKAKIMNTSKIV